MSEGKSFGTFMAVTRPGAVYTRHRKDNRRDVIKLNGRRLTHKERDALLAEFEAWEPPASETLTEDSTAAQIADLSARVHQLERASVKPRVEK